MYNLYIDLYIYEYIYIYIYITFLGIQILFSKRFPLKFVSSNIWWSIKAGGKLLSGLITISVFPSDIPLDFDESVRVVQWKYFFFF